jgi:hypothetical protein
MKASRRARLPSKKRGAPLRGVVPRSGGLCCYWGLLRNSASGTKGFSETWRLLSYREGGEGPPEGSELLPPPLGAPGPGEAPQ